MSWHRAPHQALPLTSPLNGWSAGPRHSAFGCSCKLAGELPTFSTRFALGCQGILFHVDSEILHLSPTSRVPCPASCVTFPNAGLPLSSRQALRMLLLLLRQLPSGPGWTWRTCICARTAGVWFPPPRHGWQGFMKIDFSLATYTEMFQYFNDWGSCIHIYWVMSTQLELWKWQR